jgi:hypothetical protein
VDASVILFELTAAARAFLVWLAVSRFGFDLGFGNAGEGERCIIISLCAVATSLGTHAKGLENVSFHDFVSASLTLTRTRRPEMVLVHFISSCFEILKIASFNSGFSDNGGGAWVAAS